MGLSESVAHARNVADAVLYEGYLLYPYRASSGKNQARWQFGVLGPVGAVESGNGEDPSMASQFLLRPAAGDATVTVYLRFLQLQRRTAQSSTRGGTFEDVAELVVGERRWLTWDEATEREVSIGPCRVRDLAGGRSEQVDVPSGRDEELVHDLAGTVGGRLIRTCRPLRAEVHLRAEPVGAGFVRLEVRTTNVAAGASGDHDSAIAASFIGAHWLVAVDGAEVISMTDPPAEAAAAASACRQHRCWPVLAGPSGDASVMLASPIILYDHPELAEQSAGALFDSTEIDEILTLRVMTLTDEEKEAARATDARAAQIIDRCDAMSDEAMQQLHGVLRNPHALDRQLAAELDVFTTPGSGSDTGLPWWDPAVDGSVSPSTDHVLIDGVAVSAGSMVTVQPSRRADAQDLFFAGQQAKVAAVHTDVDGATHVAVVLVDDPAADLHDWYGRYLYFAPDELEPMHGGPPASEHAHNREESRS